MRIIFSLVLYLHACSCVYGLYEGMYCGKENCYEVLRVSREDSKGDISRAYRKLARLWHPDMHSGEKAKKEAERQFQRVATAYEILRDDDSKRDYDYMLDNPDEFYWHYYTYYYRRVRPKVDVRIVIAVTISVISVIQYYVAWSNYNTAISYLVSIPKYRMAAMEIARREKLIETDKRKQKGKSKNEIREEEEAVLKSIVENKMDIKGGYSKPEVTNVLWVQLLLLPYTSALYIYWYANWVWRFNIKKEEYGEEQKLYLIKKFMGCSKTQWEAVDESQRENYLKLGLWQYEKFKHWKEEQEREQKIKLADSAKYRSYRRYMKNNKSQMTFGPE